MPLRQAAESEMKAFRATGQTLMRTVLPAAAFAALFACAIVLEMSARKYMPHNNADIFALLQTTGLADDDASLPIASSGEQRMLFCTMLTNDFQKYAAGAAMLAQALQRDAPVLRGRLGIRADLAVLEMQATAPAISLLLFPLVV